MVLMRIILAIIQRCPIFGFLQGAPQNWRLVSNILHVEELIVLVIAALTVLKPF